MHFLTRETTWASLRLVKGSQPNLVMISSVVQNVPSSTVQFLLSLSSKSARSGGLSVPLKPQTTTYGLKTVC